MDKTAGASFEQRSWPAGQNTRMYFVSVHSVSPNDLPNIDSKRKRFKSNINLQFQVTFSFRVSVLGEALKTV